MSTVLEKARALEEQAREILLEAEKKAAAIEAEIEQLKSEERKEALASIVKTMADLGISLESVEKAWKKSGAAKKFDSSLPKKFPPKFRGPDGQEWTGTGRRPGWIKDLESKGHSLDEFLIPGAK